MRHALLKRLRALSASPGWLSEIDLREHEDKIVMLLAMVVSAIVGLIVVVFVAVTEHLGAVLLTAGPAQRFLSPLLGSLLAGWLLFRYFPEARGSGIPQTRVALLLQDGFISLRTAVGKFVCSSISLGSGVALGREGPSVHIGAGVASVAARRLGLSVDSVRSLIPVGTAAAVAAAFNTPLAAVLFTLEEILADLHARVVGSVVIGAATSWIVLRLILGDEPLFHVPAYQLVHPLEFLIYALLGLLGGLVSTAFVKILLLQRSFFLKMPEKWKPVSPALGGLVVGALALAVPGVLGVGYHLVGDALNGQMALKMMLLLLALKLIATASSYASGNAGGIFGPSLFIGAMLGGSVGQVAHWLLPDLTGNAGAYALVGMGAAFAGIIRTPMTSVIMIFEVTRDYTIIVPLMIANLCSYFLSQRLQRIPIYEALSRQEGIRMPSAAHRPEPLTVAQAMQPATGVADSQFSVYPDDPLDIALRTLGRTGASELAVLSRSGGSVVGRITQEDVLAAYRPGSTPSAVRQPQAPRPRGLLLIGATILAAVLLISGLLYWQRSRRTELGEQSYRNARNLLASGRADEAVAALRTGLAYAPQNSRLRASLGLALIRTGHYREASAYLSQAAKADPSRGVISLGLAEAALNEGDKTRALELLRQAVSKEWTPEDETMRWDANFRYAMLLGETGRTSASVARLLALVEQEGDNPVLARQAADAVRKFGGPEQVENAMLLLTRQFPADSTAWLRLGDARFAAGKDPAALDAYRRAAQTDPESVVAKQSVTRLEGILLLDPTRRGLPVRERARRWDEVLQRVLAAVDRCGASSAAAEARPLLKQRAATLELSDRKMAAATRVWLEAPASCRADPVVSHIMAKLGESAP